MTIYSLSTVPSRRQPKQGRSRALVDAICQACVQIIESGRGEQLSVSLIAKTAGVTVSSFYQYFPNIDAAVGHALSIHSRDDRQHEPVNSELRAWFEALSLDETIDFLVNSMCDHHVRLLARHGDIYRRFHRYFHLPTFDDCEEIESPNEIRLYEWLRHFLNKNRSSFNAPSIDIAAFLTATAIFEEPRKALELCPALIGDAAFRKELTNFILGYLHTEASTASGVSL